MVSSPVIGDLDGSGVNEVIVGTYDSRKGGHGGLHAFTSAGERFPGWPVLLGESFESAPALADLDGDGTLEVCILGRTSQLLHAVHHHGFETGGWPIGPL